MLHVVLLGDELLLPRVGLRIGRWPEHQQPGAGAFGPFDAFRVQRCDDQLELLVAVDVGPLDPMQVRLGTNREHLPLGRAAGGVLLHPLQRAGVGPGPPGAQCDVEAAVAVDIVRRERDVVGGGHTGAENHLLLPLRRLEPDELGPADREHVHQLVAVDVTGDDGVADPEVGGDVLGAELQRG